MSSWVKVGNKCVCVRGFKGGAGWPPLVEGTQYTIREVMTHPETGELGVRLLDMNCGLSRFHMEKGWEANRFRPLVSEQDDIDMFKALLTPTPELVPVED